VHLLVLFRRNNVHVCTEIMEVKQLEGVTRGVRVPECLSAIVPVGG
jgi:hypothetical protein